MQIAAVAKSSGSGVTAWNDSAERSSHILTHSRTLHRLDLNCFRSLGTCFALARFATRLKKLIFEVHARVERI
jgi:hypothetical protein